MGLWNNIKLGQADTICDNCENYQKKEVKETFEDSFTVSGNKNNINNYDEIKILWYDVRDNAYEICFLTKQKQRITINYDRAVWKKLTVNQVR